MAPLAAARSRAVTLVIVFFLGGVLVPFSAYLQTSRISNTQSALEVIREKLYQFASRNGRLPFPADPAGTTGLEWIDPAYAMGNWGPELVAMAGGELALGHPGQLSYGMANERVLEANPEYLIVAPCGFDLDRTVREAEGVLWWNGVRSKIAVADGNLFFNRSGMTVSRTAEIIAEMLHGEVFGQRTEGVHWKWMKS